MTYKVETLFHCKRNSSIKYRQLLTQQGSFLPQMRRLPWRHHAWLVPPPFCTSPVAPAKQLYMCRHWQWACPTPPGIEWQRNVMISITPLLNTINTTHWDLYNMCRTVYSSNRGLLGNKQLFYKYLITVVSQGQTKIILILLKLLIMWLWNNPDNTYLIAQLLSGDIWYLQVICQPGRKCIFTHYYICYI